MGSDGLRGVRVAPLSTNDIVKIAQEVRKYFGLDNIVRVCPVRMIEALQYSGVLEFEVIEDHKFPRGKEAETCPDERYMRIRQSVYDGACGGDPRSRFTLAHELGHFILHREMKSFARMADKSHKRFEDSEWQADTFAGELLIDNRLINSEMTVDEIMNKFGVSRSAAETKLRKLSKSGYNRGRKDLG